MTRIPSHGDAASEAVEITLSEAQLFLADDIARWSRLTRNAAVSRAVQHVAALYEEIGGRRLVLRDEGKGRLRELDLNIAICFDAAESDTTAGQCRFLIRVPKRVQESKFWRERLTSAPGASIWVVWEMLTVAGEPNSEWQVGSLGGDDIFEPVNLVPLSPGISAEEAAELCEGAALLFQSDDMRHVAWREIDEVLSTSELDFDAKLDFAKVLDRSASQERNHIEAAMLVSCIESEEMRPTLVFDERTYTAQPSYTAGVRQ